MKSETIVEMVVKQRNGNHFIKIDEYKGDVNTAYDILEQKYVCRKFKNKLKVLNERLERDFYGTD